MPKLTYASWPFRSPDTLPSHEAQQWQAHCFWPHPVVGLMAGWSHGRVLLGGPGSGKSILLAALEAEELAARRSFVVRYSPGRWPGGRQALIEAGNHLAQIMAAAALSLRDYFNAAPAEVDQLTPRQHIVLRWLMDDYLGQRAFNRWRDGLPEKQAQALQSVPYEQLYASTTQPLEVVGQVDEAVNLVRRLGFQRIVLTVDVSSREAPVQSAMLGELFSWLELMQQPNLALMAAVPHAAAEQIDLISRARSRINVARLEWSLDQVKALAERCLQVALNDPTACFERLVTREALALLAERLAAEYGGDAPQGWIWLAETLLYCANREQVPTPFGIEWVDRLWLEFCARHFPLELLAGRGVWRGPRFITIDPQPLRLIDLLWRSRDPINIDDPGMKRILGQTKNPKSLLHTLARRLRQAIEPDPSNPIYLINDRGEGGYWLDNIVRMPPSLL
jgi:hypothetical protein